MQGSEQGASRSMRAKFRKVDWQTVCQQLQPALPRKLADDLPAVLIAANERLTVRVEGASAHCSAEVTQAGSVAIGLPLLMSLQKLISSSPEPEVVLSATDGRLAIEGNLELTGSIEVHPPGIRHVSLPVAPDLPSILALRPLYTREEISASGYEARIARAEQEAERLLEQAAQYLRPLQITRVDLRAMLDRKIAHVVSQRTEDSADKD